MCSWIVLIACFLEILSNGFILFYIVLVTIVFVVAWAVVGCFLCTQLLKHRVDFPVNTGQPTFISPKRAGAWMEKLTGVIYVIGVMGLMLSMVFLYLGVKGIATVRPASNYEELGLFT